ncbi:GntP family permease [Tetragenococcus halophilus]|uniref:GntP family permease n=1 Tax=Tetragenococcus halophilus TaxID=51669 RepID=UPI000CBDAEA8|nr:gluconate:H+ symporter [Tetragenococcus halophilus]MCO8284417.1 TRAP transporter large permease subunit [Tetragenococcus halophilus]MCO8287472.1 TRAP transporter large permease subunit [Tetragenococcus halophilus]GBD65473.1 putative gluconate permease [Tetragenococcus halophilus subsp. halophilus]GBD77527.1 putative gluconate permease [Tetragenococcus halophilus subsp. halophilus]
MGATVSSTQLLVGLLIGIATLIFLAMKTRIHTFVALLIASIITGLIGGLPFESVMESITEGFGSTLGSTGIIIGLGVMMGAVLEKSGAAERMAFSIIKLIGQGKEEWALSFAGYIVAIPVFSDSGLVILTPLAKSLSRTTGKSVVGLGLALATGLQLTHVFVPPTPGPLTVAGILNIDLGIMIMTGIALTIPTIIASTIYCIWVGKKIYQVPNEDGTGYIRKDYKEEYIKSIDNIKQMMEEKNLPNTMMSFAPIIVPIIFILSDTVMNFLNIQGTLTTITGFIGNPIIALIVGLILSIYGLARRFTKDELMSAMEDGIKTTGMIMLVTGAGGALGYVVQDAGIGNALGEAIISLNIPGILIPFIIAAVMRISLGSATVALVTAATLTAPLVSQLGLDSTLVGMSTCAGAVSFSYFNDSGFWVFNGLYGLKNIKDQFMCKTVVSFVGAGTALVVVLVANAFVG